MDQLRAYSAQHVDSPDVALELPTGSGKTLVGLLVAEWRRRNRRERVVYACPTRQLALQVVDAGRRQGIELHALIDSHSDWDPRHVTAYNRSEAIAVTTYSHIFNANSHLADAKTIVFDDAHAAEGYVADAWALDVPRSNSVYGDLLDAFAGAVEPHALMRMSGEGADTASAHEVRLIPISAVADRLNDLDSVLGAGLLPRTPLRYRFSMIRESLGSCLFYVSRSKWYIRPMIPPTFQHPAYVDPEQRVYLSATLGEAGELERAFGRAPIARISSPPAWERTGSGRRFFVFPDLARFEPATDTVAVAENISEELTGLAELEQPSLTRRLADLAPKRLILTQRGGAAEEIANDLGVPRIERVVASDLTVETFKQAQRGTLLAANRYDGMDLADNTCRFMIMADVPTASHLQDRFLSSKLRAGDVLAERIRTRVVQGAGRCTRGPQDWAVVVVEGEALLRYLSNPDNTMSMPVELQAEIEFGIAASIGSYSNVVALTRSALAQDEDWREHGETALAEGRARALRAPQPMAGDLAGSAPREVEAWQLAWLGDWEGAARSAVMVHEALTAPKARPYRALWAYFASAWFDRAAMAGNVSAASRAADLLVIAQRAAPGSVWLREIQAAASSSFDYEPYDTSALGSILSLRTGAFRSAATFSHRVQTMLGQLAQQDASQYELGLIELGLLLGAESFKPSGPGKADAAWIWDSLWISIEAKSEQTADRLSMAYVRQTNTHLSSIAHDSGVDAAPIGSVSIVAAHSRLVDPNAVPIAAPHVHLITTDVLLDIAHDAHRAWVAIRAGVTGGDDEATRSELARILWDHRVLPGQVKERLTPEPIRGI
ncbi:MAG: DEAD/DEAH box helicase [Salinibacterium amurskyense]